MDFKKIKSESSELCKTAKPSLIVMGLIFTALSILVSTLSSSVLSTNITEEGISRYFYSFYNGNTEKALEVATNFQPSKTGVIISILLTLVLWIVTAGFVIFILNTVRRKETSYSSILDGFGIAIRVLLMNILPWLVIGLLSLLLIFPGVIAFYGYRQTMYLVIDRPELSVIGCMKESRKMMKGHKWELFRLDLSFIGWYILSAVLPMAGVWVTPYVNTAYAIYYERLCGVREDYSGYSSEYGYSV